MSFIYQKVCAYCCGKLTDEALVCCSNACGLRCCSKFCVDEYEQKYAKDHSPHTCCFIASKFETYTPDALHQHTAALSTVYDYINTHIHARIEELAVLESAEDYFTKALVFNRGASPLHLVMTLHRLSKLLQDMGLVTECVNKRKDIFKLEKGDERETAFMIILKDCFEFSLFDIGYETINNCKDEFGIGYLRGVGYEAFLAFFAAKLGRVNEAKHHLESVQKYTIRNTTLPPVIGVLVFVTSSVLNLATRCSLDTVQMVHTAFGIFSDAPQDFFATLVLYTIQIYLTQNTPSHRLVFYWLDNIKSGCTQVNSRGKRKYVESKWRSVRALALWQTKKWKEACVEMAVAVSVFHPMTETRDAVDARQRLIDFKKYTAEIGASGKRNGVD